MAGEGTAGPEPAAPAAAIPPEREAAEVRAVPEGTPLLQMSPNFVTPGMAFGSYFPVSQLDSAGVRIEPVTVRAAVNAGVGYNDNVTLSATNKISSMFFSVAPSVSVALEGGTQRYYATYRGNYGRFPSSGADNYEDHSVGVNAINEWTTRIRTLASYEFLRGHDPRGSTAATLARLDRWNLQTLRGTASYGADGAPARIEGTLGYLKREYTTSQSLNAARDYDQIDVGGTFYYRVAPKTRALVQIVHSDIAHDAAPSLDATENRYLVGVTWDALAKTQGRFAAGYMTRDFSNAPTPSFSAPTYEVAATWSPLPYSVFDLSGRRTIAEPNEPGSSFIVVNVLSARWNHAWSDRVRSTAGYLYGDQKHEGIGRVDTYQTFDLTVSYALQRRLRLGVQLRHDSRTSPDPTFEYKRNVTLVTLESAL